MPYTGGPRGAPRSVDRREFLRRAGASAVLLPTAAALLASCTEERPASSSSEPFPLARPDSPVSLPLNDDNPPIADGLKPERGATLRIFNWEEYIWKKVADEFGQRYGADIEIVTFDNMDDAIPRLLRGEVQADLFFHRVDELDGLVRSKILQPLNQSYIPNLKKHVWPVYRNPFYDLGSRYTVPYTIYTTGIAWRADLVEEDIASMPNPYEIFWSQRYSGKIHLINDYREVIGMALLKNGITDVNTARRQQILTAAEDLRKLSDLVGNLDIDAYSDLPAGDAWIHQAYSGDVLAAPYYFPKGEDPSVLRYWSPPQGGGVVANDVIGVLKGARNPVLAHNFVNYLLDSKTSVKNFSWNGYQPPTIGLNPNLLTSEGYVPPYLKPSIVRRSDFNRSYMQLALAQQVDQLWHRAYAKFERSVG